MKIIICTICFATTLKLVWSNNIDGSRILPPEPSLQQQIYLLDVFGGSTSTNIPLKKDVSEKYAFPTRKILIVPPLLAIFKLGSAVLGAATLAKGLAKNLNFKVVPSAPKLASRSHMPQHHLTHSSFYLPQYPSHYPHSLPRHSLHQILRPSKSVPTYTSAQT